MPNLHTISAIAGLMCLSPLAVAVPEEVVTIDGSNSPQKKSVSVQNPASDGSTTASFEKPVRVMGMAESSQTQPSRLYIQFARHAGYRPEKGLAISSQAFEFFGGLGRIRTPDPLIRSQVLYPTELPIHREWGFSGGGRVMQDPNAKLLLFCRGGQ